MRIYGWLGLVFCLVLNGAGQACLGQNAHEQKISYTPPAAPPGFLQGGVQATEKLPPPPGFCARINGLGTYQQAWYALGQHQYQVAADWFQVAGDQMEASAGETKFLAEARFAEAQTRRLIGQYDRSRDMYKRSIELFEHTDPRSFYLKAAQDGLRDLTPPTQPLKGKVSKDKEKEKAVLKAMPIPGIDKVAGDIQLSSRITKLDTGVGINTLHNGDFFNRSRGTLLEAAGVDLSDEFAKDVIHKAWLKMNCTETTTVGATHYSAPLFYKPITADGKPIVVGAGSDLMSPTAELMLNGKMYKVSMDLPRISPNTRNVMLVTDDRHVLAIDPRTSEAWKLCANFSKKVPDFSWWKLGRQKGRKFS